MRADDGFVHASARLEASRSCDALAVLRGPGGMGRLVIEPESIAFNGNSFLGQSGDAFSIERPCGQLVQMECGLLRWVDAPAQASPGRTLRSS